MIELDIKQEDDEINALNAEISKQLVGILGDQNNASF